MLCNVCHLIFESGAQARKYRLESIGVEHGRTTRYIHHATTRSLIDSANLYCYICSKVWKDAISHGFTRGPELRWQSSCSTSYVVQTLDRQTLSISSLELLVSYVRKRRVIDDEPGPDEIIFWSKFVLEPASAVLGDLDDAEKSRNTIESTGSGSAWNLASRWIFDCIANHKECIQPGSLGKQLPTRLINVGDPGSSSISLYEGNDLLYETNDLLNSTHEDYVTLSHCWGRVTKILTLNKSTYEVLKSGVNESKLPKTFRDAIQLTRRLGVKYIWIDSLCIFQDSVDDWLRESSAMTRIYRQALCNISALASLTSDGGCFRERDARSIEPCSIDAQWVGLPKGLLNIHYEKLWEFDVAAAPLHKRAWVVQERLLAPRVLHFGREQLFWECHTMNACETYPDGLPPCLTLSDPTIYFKGLNPSRDGESLRKISNWDCSDSSLNQLYVWEKVVKTYTACALTREQDKLIAISGIAKRLQPLSSNDVTDREGKLATYRSAQYLAGLWDFFLLAQLLWEVKQGSRPSMYRAPSWSWASLDGQVSFHAAFNDGNDLVKILESTTETVSEDPFGQVRGGLIRLQGNLAAVIMTATSQFNGDEIFTMNINGQHISALCRPDITNDRPNGRLYCMPIRSYRMTTGSIGTQRLGCLILSPTGTSRGQYRRWAQVTLENSLDQRALDRPTREKIDDYEELNASSGRYTITIV